MIKFDVNAKALKSMAEVPMATNSIKAALDGRTKSPVEACGANYDRVVGGYPDPSASDYLDGLDQNDPYVKKLAAKIPRPSAFSHGFMEAVHMSFQDHYPLVITPDSVWLTLAQGFGHHVNANAEKLRKQFVSHEGKKMLLIRRDYFSKGSPHNDWPGCFTEFSDKIQEHIGKKRDLIVGNFSTTGPIEKAASELVLMDSMKSYFKYAVRTLCGIPSVTLTGTVDDWRSIRTRAENFSEFDLDWWVKSLIPTLDQFIKAAEGNPDIKFWDSMYKLEGMSGGPYCSGWANTLFPYLTDYKGIMVKNKYAEKWDDTRGFGHGPSMDAYPNSLSKVPFKWEIGGQTHDMEFLGGVVGVSQHEKTLEVEPAIGWAVRDTGTVRDGGIDEKEDW
jgi:hypothetical protein